MGNPISRGSRQLCGAGRTVASGGLPRELPEEALLKGTSPQDAVVHEPPELGALPLAALGALHLDTLAFDAPALDAPALDAVDAVDAVGTAGALGAGLAAQEGVLSSTFVGVSPRRIGEPMLKHFRGTLPGPHARVGVGT